MQPASMALVWSDYVAIFPQDSLQLVWDKDHTPGRDFYLAFLFLSGGFSPLADTQSWHHQQQQQNNPFC